MSSPSAPPKPEVATAGEALPAPEDGVPRIRHAVAQGAKAAGLTAAGLAGGALLESRIKRSSKLAGKLPKLPRNLPLPRRRSRAQIIRDEVLKRLPSPS